MSHPSQVGQQQERYIEQRYSNPVLQNATEDVKTTGAPLGTGRSGFARDEIFNESVDQAIEEGGGAPGAGGAGPNDGGYSGRSAAHMAAAAMSDQPEIETKLDDNDDLLELEHVVGYSGGYLRTLVTHPSNPATYIKALGAMVAVGDLNDPHSQEFLRGHDMDVSCLAISPTGAMIASGQIGTTNRKGHASPVIVWDANTRKRVFVLQGHTVKVNLLAFSPDERFLCACGEDSLMYIWDMVTGEVVFGKRYPKPVCIFEWCAIVEKGRRPSYEIVLGVGTGTNATASDSMPSQVVLCELSFDATRQQWSMNIAPFVMPTSGMARDYHCSGKMPGGDYIVAGTSVGDMLVYKQSAQVYRASIPVCSNGLLSMVVVQETGQVFCGGGDGWIRRLSGDDMRWQLEAEINVGSAVVSLAQVANGGELLAGCANGTSFRVLVDDLSFSPLEHAHVGKVTCCAFGSRSDVVATGDDRGVITVWDLSNYSVISRAAETGISTEGACKCLTWIGDGAVLAGFEDHYLRCYTAGTGKRSWIIPDAHRAEITSVAVHSDASLAFVVSAAADGCVRVWALRSHEMMLQFCEHQKPVTQVLVDVKQPHLVHSCGTDCAVFTYDLRRERRTVAHMVREGQFTTMSQRFDSEQELVTADNNGKLMFWDCDIDEAVATVRSPLPVSCLQVSPSGRFFAIAGDYTVMVYDTATVGGPQCEPIAAGIGHSGKVNALVWSPDERQLVSVGDDSCVSVWNFFGAM